MDNKKCEDANKLYSELSKTISLTLSFEIKRLNQLYKRGIITEEEFIDAKKKLLSIPIKFLSP